MGLLYDADTTVWGNHVTENPARSLSRVSKLSANFLLWIFSYLIEFF